MKIGKYDIVEIREDAEGELWFRVADWGHDAERDWWVFLSDEYGGPVPWDDPTPVKTYELREIEK